MTYACQFKTPLIVVAAVSALVFVSKRTDFFTIICSKITKSFNSAFEKNTLDESDQTDVVELEDTMPTIIVSNSAPSLPSKNQIQNGASNGIGKLSFYWNKMANDFRKLFLISQSDADSKFQRLLIH